MSVKNTGDIAAQNFASIKAALQNFADRHPTGGAKSTQIEEVANSSSAKRYINVTYDVHSHAPYKSTTLWFTCTMFDADDTPEEFHIFVSNLLWPDVLLLEKVPNGDPAFPPPPAGPVPGAGNVASYWNTLKSKDITWF